MRMNNTPTTCIDTALQAVQSWSLRLTLQPYLPVLLVWALDRPLFTVLQPHSWSSVKRQLAIGTNWNIEDAIWNQGNISLLRVWLSMWTGRSERSWDLPPWRYWKAVWTCVWQPALRIPAGKLASKVPFQSLPFGDMIFPWGFFQLGVRMWAEHIPDPRVRKHCEVPKFQYKQSLSFPFRSLLCETDEPFCCHWQSKGTGFYLSIFFEARSGF